MTLFRNLVTRRICSTHSRPVFSLLLRDSRHVDRWASNFVTMIELRRRWRRYCWMGWDGYLSWLSGMCASESIHIFIVNIQEKATDNGKRFATTKNHIPMLPSPPSRPRPFPSLWQRSAHVKTATSVVPSRRCAGCSSNGLEQCRWTVTVALRASVIKEAWSAEHTPHPKPSFVSSLTRETKSSSAAQHVSRLFTHTHFALHRGRVPITHGLARSHAPQTPRVPAADGRVWTPP